MKSDLPDVIESKIRMMVNKELFNSSHDIEHINRVYKTCLIIADSYGYVNLRILKTSALLHDIARAKEDSDKSGEINHAIIGAVMAGIILGDLDYTNEEIDKVYHCIVSHRFRGNNNPMTLEAKILFDADKIDILGAIGIARSFMHAGEFGERMYSNVSIDDYIRDNLEGGKSYGRIKKISLHAPNIEYETKIKKIYDRMFTDAGKEIAITRIRFIDEFFIELRKELGVE